jgi:hypothetical protein
MTALPTIESACHREGHPVVGLGMLMSEGHQVCHGLHLLGHNLLQSEAFRHPKIQYDDACFFVAQQWHAASITLKVDTHELASTVMLEADGPGL